MRNLILALAVGCASMIAPVALAPAASAEPLADTWYCASAYSWDPISRYQFYGCPMSTLLVFDGYTGKKKMIIDGYCANQLHMRRPSATWYDAVSKCLIRRF